MAEAETMARSSNAYLAGGLRYGAAESPHAGFWALYDRPKVVQSSQLRAFASPSPVFTSSLSPAITREAYGLAFAKIKKAIELGNCYQVNLTMKLTGKAVSPEPWSWKTALRLWLDLLEPGGDRASGQGRHAAFCLSPDGEIIASLSPELFFSVDGSRVTARPMKGTAPRHTDPILDESLRSSLEKSPKNRAENLMIVDLVRNDLGRIATPGGVKATGLFQTEAYPSLWQMTSTVQATIPQEIGLRELLEAQFPCASITGAPKISAQKIIAETEDGDRGWYTGTLGWYQPGDRAQNGSRTLDGTLDGDRARGCFSVLIRSLIWPKQNDCSFSLGVGGGIVWDSLEEDEFNEALLKSKFLRGAARRFSLTEALLWEEDGGFFLEDYHRQRLASACAEYGTLFDEGKFKSAIAVAVRNAQAQGLKGSLKLRVLVDPDSKLSAEAETLSATPGIMRCAISKNALSMESLPFRRHKTTERGCYAGAAEAGLDQLIFINEAGEITEASSMNVVVKKDGRLISPATSCGLLYGTFRRQLLESGQIEEGILYEKDLRSAEAIYLVNSVRRWVRAVLVDDLTGG